MSAIESEELLARARQRLNHHPTYLEVIDAQIVGDLIDHIEALTKIPTRKDYEEVTKLLADGFGASAVAMALSMCRALEAESDKLRRNGEWLVSKLCDRCLIRINKEAP